MQQVSLIIFGATLMLAIDRAAYGRFGFAAAYAVCAALGAYGIWH